MYVLKKDGQIRAFDKDKLSGAILAAAKQVTKVTTKEIAKAGEISKEIEECFNRIETEDPIPTSELHNIVQQKLERSWPEVYDAYASYRNYKKEMAQAFKKIHEESEGILYAGDNENANKDSTLNSTKQALISASTMGKFVNKYELAPEWVKAHNEGWIHIHDKSEKYLRGFNCCLFDMGNLLKGGFKMNGSKYSEPKSAQTALAVIGDTTLSASAQEFGGFSIPEIDTVVAPYAEKSYQAYLLEKQRRYPNENPDRLEKFAKEDTIRELEQGVQGFETKLNTVSNSLGQVPFVTISLGLNTSEWGREVSKAILKVRKKGINGTTQVFPKIVFLHRNEINGVPGSPNYDLKLLSIECSQIRMYPDYLSLDEGNLKEVYDRCGKAVTPMGCRAYLSPAYDKNGEEFYIGRNNIGAVSLNLVKMAIEANKNWDKFYELVDRYSQIVWDIHDDYYNKISKMKGSSDPLYWCEGGSGKGREIGYDEEIGDLYQTSTASLGYIGVWEALKALGVSDKSLNTKGVEIVQHLRNNVEDNKLINKHSYITALYSTPGESLCYRFQKLNKQQYGVIPEVTDREYMTNSFHVPVWEEVTVPEKLKYEAPFHKIATGGRISYNEYKFNTDLKVLHQAIDVAMKLGLYYGVNIVSTTCENCGNQGDFMDECPKCGSTDLTEVTRCCGYLSFNKINGKSRYNEGKEAEIRDRVKHAGKDSL